MIYMAAYEPGDRLYNREREHSLGRRLLNFGLEREYGRTWEVRDGSEAEPADADPADAEPANADPAEADPADAEPADAEPAETDPAGIKPYLYGAPGISFNISHTNGLAVCAISSRTVGVDAERIRPFKKSLLRHICSEEEISFVLTGLVGTARKTAIEAAPADPTMAQQERFFRLWTLKESFVKAVGQGLRFPLKNITFSWEENIPETGYGLSRIKGSIPGWHFYQSRVYQSYIISVCEADEEGESA